MIVFLDTSKFEKNVVKQDGVRKITNKGGRKIVGMFASTKMKNLVPWESQIERDYCYFLEYDKDVIKYRTQPLKIRYLIDGKYHTHTPDFEVIRESLFPNPNYVEIKDYTEASSNEYRLKHIARNAYFKELGLSYQLLTDKDLREGFALENIKMLYKYVTLEVSEEALSKVLSFVSSGFRTGNDLLNFYRLNNIYIGEIYSMIFNGFIEFDVNRNFNDFLTNQVFIQG